MHVELAIQPLFELWILNDLIPTALLFRNRARMLNMRNIVFIRQTRLAVLPCIRHGAEQIRGCNHDSKV